LIIKHFVEEYKEFFRAYILDGGISFLYCPACKLSTYFKELETTQQ
jgi:hypothetical protein